jgi:hypothetical protein
MPAPPNPNPGPAPLPPRPVAPPQPTLWSSWTFRAIVILAIAAACGLAAWKGRGTYRRWRENSDVARAQSFLKERKFADAIIAARRALQRNEANVPAARVMAEIAEMVSGRDAILWRSRVATLEPGRIENLHAWA